MENNEKNTIDMYCDECNNRICGYDPNDEKSDKPDFLFLILRILCVFNKHAWNIRLHNALNNLAICYKNDDIKGVKNALEVMNEYAENNPEEVRAAVRAALGIK